MTGADVHGARPTRPQLALVVGAVVALLAVGSVRGFWLSNLHNGVLALAFAGVGSYVLVQRPTHREGVLLLATGVVEAVTYAGRQVGHSPSIDGSRWWAWLGVWPTVVALALTTLAVICFPDGRLPSPRWRWVAAAVVLVAGGCALLSALWPVEYAAAGVSTGHPLEATAPPVISTLWSAIAHPAYVAFQVLWVVAVVARWRSSDGRVRRQLAWLVLAAGLSAGALVVGLVGWGSPRAGVLAAALVPVAAGWAIVHGQHVAAYSALTWLSRADPRSPDLPDDFARAVAEALDASAATLWMGSPDGLHVVGRWPPAQAPGDGRPGGSPDRQVRTVWRAGEAVGAIGIDRAVGDSLSLAEARLLDDLAAQAALVIEHRGLAAVIAGQRRAGALDGLSPREQEVLELLSRGLSNSAICHQLHLSIKTVEPVVSAIFTKLGLQPDAASNRRVLAARAYLRS